MAGVESDGLAPGPVRNLVVKPRKFAVVVDWAPPNAWDDGSFTDFNLAAAVSHYEVDLLNAAGGIAAQDLHVVRTKCRFEKEDLNGAGPYKPRVRVIGFDNQYTETATTGTADPATVTAESGQPHRHGKLHSHNQSKTHRHGKHHRHGHNNSHRHGKQHRHSHSNSHGHGKRHRHTHSTNHTHAHTSHTHAQTHAHDHTNAGGHNHGWVDHDGHTHPIFAGGANHSHNGATGVGGGHGHSFDRTTGHDHFHTNNSTANTTATNPQDASPGQNDDDLLNTDGSFVGSSDDDFADTSDTSPGDTNDDLTDTTEVNPGSPDADPLETDAEQTHTHEIV